MTPPPGNWPYGTILGVTNSADYASTLEVRDWPQPMTKVFRAAQRRYHGKIDIRLKWITAEEAGGTKYSAPAIEIAHLKALAGFTGIQYIKRRGSSALRNVKTGRRPGRRYEDRYGRW